jgi:hypothetical protein
MLGEVEIVASVERDFVWIVDAVALVVVFSSDVKHPITLSLTFSGGNAPLKKERFSYNLCQFSKLRKVRSVLVQ